MNYPKTVLVLLAAALVATVSHRVCAQDDARAFSIKNLQATPLQNGFIGVEGASVPEDISFLVKAFFNYQYKPLVIRRCNVADGNTCSDWSNRKDAVISHKVDAELLGSIALFGIFEAGVSLPVVMYQKSTDILGETGNAESIGIGGLEDIRLHLKLDILQGIFKHPGGKYKLSLALIPVVSFPVGNAVQDGSFMGDSFLTVHPKAAMGMQFGRTRLGVNLGYFIAKEKETYLATVGSALTYGAAVDIEIIDRLGIIAEAFGRQALKKDLASAPWEMLVGAHYDFDIGLSVVGGVGAGIFPGVGTPPVRVFTGVSWSPGNISRKKSQAEAMEEMDIKPEDWDDDNIMDASDKCPESAEDYDGFEDGDGCPDTDNDGDDIKDMSDKCPDVAEDADGFEDEDGCPEYDNDKDGVPDEDDKCEDRAEVLNGHADEDGCPDKGKWKVKMSAERLDLSKPIAFKGKNTQVKGSASEEMLDIVAGLLGRNERLKVEIQVHAKGKNAQQTASDRAGAVVANLVEKGVDAGQISVAKKPVTKKPAKSNVTIEIVSD